MNKEIKFRVWILSAKENWTGVDNFETFDWDNRMRFVDSMHFPLNKFSGKDISCEPICENDNYSNGWIGNSFNSVNSESKKEYVLMQFTGLLDKNGKEIYEGDIVKWGMYPNSQEFYHRYSVVKINPDIQFSIIYYLAPKTRKIQSGNGKVFHFGSFAYKDTENHLEVIGNIYENPELLDGSVVA